MPQNPAVVWLPWPGDFYHSWVHTTFISGFTIGTKVKMLPLKMRHARRQGLKFAWVGGDAGYGKGLDFPLTLDESGETFLIDVRRDQMVYLEEPHLEIPVYSGRGRKPEKPRPNLGLTQIYRIYNSPRLCVSARE